MMQNTRPDPPDTAALPESFSLSFAIGAYQCQALKCSHETLLCSIPSHSHSSNSWEIHYISSGKGTITLAGETHAVIPGTLFVTGPHVEHAQFPDAREPMTEFCVYLKFETRSHAPAAAETPAFLRQFFTADRLFCPDTQGISSLMEAIFYELSHRAIGYETLLEGFLTQLLILVVRNQTCTAAEKPVRTPSPDDRSYLLIEEYFLFEYQNLSLVDLSARLGLSRRQTERLLQKHYGKTFQQKKAEAKMAAALLLLENPTQSVSEIAAALGYSSAEHFSTAFRNYHGNSPRAWRKQHGISTP